MDGESERGRRTAFALAVVAAACLALATVAAGAGAQRREANAKATRTYLRARFAEARVLTAEVPEGIAAIKTRGRQFQEQCPGVLANAPRLGAGKKPGRAETEITDEIEISILGEYTRPEKQTIAHFARAVRGLDWSAKTLTRLVHSYAAEELAGSSLPPPNVCGDIEAWAASGYGHTAGSTQRYLHKVNAITSIVSRASGRIGGVSGSNVENVIESRLAPYEDRCDEAVAVRIQQIEVTASRRSLARILRAFSETRQALYASS